LSAVSTHVTPTPKPIATGVDARGHRLRIRRVRGSIRTTSPSDVPAQRLPAPGGGALAEVRISECLPVRSILPRSFPSTREISESVPSEPLPVHTFPPANTMSVGGSPRPGVFTRRLWGSMLETVSLSVFATQTSPPSYAMPTG